MGENNPATQGVPLLFSSRCWWWWEGVDLGLNCSHGYSELHQLYHHWIVVTGQDFIFLCQSLHLIPLDFQTYFYCIHWLYFLMILFCWVGWWYTLDVLHRFRLAPFTWGGDRSSLLSKGLMVKYLECWPSLDFGCLLLTFYYIIVEGCSLSLKCDPFWRHDGAYNCLTSWSFKLPTLFEFSNNTGEGFWEVIPPHHLHGIFLEIDFVYRSVGPENML